MSAMQGRIAESRTTNPRARKVWPRDSEWSEAIDAYLAYFEGKGVSPNSVALRRYQLCRLSMEVGKRLGDVTEADLSGWLGRPSWSLQSRRTHRSAVTTFFRWCAKTRRTDHDPAEDIEPCPMPSPNPKPVTEADYARVVAECEPRIRIAIRLGGELGMRRGEVVRVHRDHLTEDQDGWTLEVLGKGSKTRFLPVSAELAAELIDHIGTYGGHGWAFPHTPKYGESPGEDHGHMTPHWLGTLVSRALPDGYTMHKLRHRAATQVHRRSGGNLLLASELLGHSNVGTTQIYVQPDRSQLRSLTAGLAEAKR